MKGTRKSLITGHSMRNASDRLLQIFTATLRGHNDVGDPALLSLIGLARGFAWCLSPRRRRPARTPLIGGGFLIVPSLVASTKMPMINAVGTSLVAVAAVGLTTALNYAFSGFID